MLGLCLLLTCATPGIGLAQTAYLQQSGIVGEGKTLSITRLPVASSSGAINYYDGAVNLTFNAAGVPVLGGHTLTRSPILVTNDFIAGRYYVKYSSDATQFGTLSYGTGSGGSTVWTLIMDVMPDGNFPDQAIWQTGNPQPDVATRLNNAKVQLDPDASYGLTTVGEHFAYTDFNYDNGLIEAKQIGNNLFLTSFTTGNGFSDTSLGQGSITMGLCTDEGCSNASK